jgi:hypothetical protein
MNSETNVVPNTDVEWYDFGGGHLIAPALDMNGKPILEEKGTMNGSYTTVSRPEKKDGSVMAAISCVRNGKYHYKIIEGDFTEADLPSMFKEYAPAFRTEVEAMTQQ